MEMGEPLVYKRTLSLLQTVAGLAQTEVSAAGRKDLSLKFEGLVGAMREAEPHERSKVMPFVVKTCFQAVSLSVETYACQIRDVKIAVVVTSSLASSLQMVLADSLGNDVAGAADLRTLFCGEGATMQTSCNELLLTVLALMEGLNSLLNDGKSPSALLADHEECCIQCFRVYNLFIRIWLKCIEDGGDADDWREQPLKGNFLAQIVQICLRFAMHDSREVAEVALECLFSSICYVNDANEWRKYYPGCFGGLFAVSTAAGKSRGSTTRFAALLCLLRLTILIANDREASNVWLLDDVERRDAAAPDGSCGGSPAKDEGRDSKAAFGALVSKLLGEETERCATSSCAETDSADTPLPAEFDSRAVFVQWRVDLLQRIQKHLPVAFTTAFESCSIRHCSHLQHWLALLLLSCRRFLGNFVFVDFLCNFLRGLQHRSPPVRQRTRELWHALGSQLRESGLWPVISSLLMDKSVQILRVLGPSGSSGADGASERLLLLHLESAISLGEALGTDLKLTLRASGPDLALSVASLASPDPQTTHSLAMQSQRYACGASSVVGSHYRCSWVHAREASTGQAARKLCVLLGRQGATGELLMAVGKFQGDLEVIERAQQAHSAADAAEGETPADKAYVGALQRLAGAWQAVSYAVLGLVTFPPQKALVESGWPGDEDTASEALTVAAACALCGKSGASVRRCTRCKAVSYCSKEHQAEHWKASHRKVCKATTTTTAPASAGGDAASGVLGLADTASRSISRGLGLPLSLSLLGASAKIGKDTPLSVPMSSTGDVLDPPELLASSECALPLRPPQGEGQTGMASAGGQDGVCLDSVCKAVLAAMNYHLPMLRKSPAGQKAQLRALTLSACAETLGHVALLLRSKFQVHLVRCLYPLLELRVSPNSTVSQAAATALDRLGLYLGCSPPGAAGLLHQSFDYFVDEACSRLRSLSKGAVASAGGASMRQVADTNTHLVVDHVLSLLTSSEQSGAAGGGGDENDDKATEQQPHHLDQESATAAMKELLLDAVGSMDALAGTGALERASARPLLGMMLVLTRRASADPADTPEGASKSESQEEWEQWYLVSGIASLRSFHRALGVILERDSAALGAHVQELCGPESALLGDKERDILSLAQKRADELAEDERQHREIVGDEGGQGEASEDPVDEAGKPLAGLRLVDAILRRCAYYLTLPHLADQVSVLRVMETAVRRLSADRAVMLPAVHKMWPSLVSKLREMRIALRAEAAARDYAGDSTRLLMTQDPSSNRAKTLALPELLRLLETVAVLSGDFLSLKFADDIWPELFLLIELVNPTPVLSKTSRLADGRGLSARQRETLDVAGEAPSQGSRSVHKLLHGEGPADLLCSPDQSSESSSWSAPAAPRSADRHSLDSKIKLSLLHCVRAIAEVPPCQPFVRRAAGKCAWHSLALLCGSQCKEVNEAASDSILSMQALDAALVGSVVHAMASSGPGGAMRRAVIAADPRLSVSASEVENAYSVFTVDETYVACVGAILKRPAQLKGLVPRSFGETLKRHSRI